MNLDPTTLDPVSHIAYGRKWPTEEHFRAHQPGPLVGVLRHHTAPSNAARKRVAARRLATESANQVCGDPQDACRVTPGCEIVRRRRGTLLFCRPVPRLW